MRYIPRLAFMMPGASTSSVYTCGRVTNAPPSMGQWCINGRSLTCTCWYSTGLLNGFFKGNAFMAARPVAKLSTGCLMACSGSLFNRISCCTWLKVLRKMKRLRSTVPKIFDAARNLLPFTFSNSNAGPPASCTRKWMAAISRYGSTSSFTRTKCPCFSRSTKHTSSDLYCIPFKQLLY